MTNGHHISSRTSDVRAIESAFDIVHDQLRALQRDARDIEAAREKALRACMIELGAEAPYAELEFEFDDATEISWKGGAPDFGKRFVEDPDVTAQALRQLLDGGELPSGLPTAVEKLDPETGEMWTWPAQEAVQKIAAEFHASVREQALQLDDRRRHLDDSWKDAAALLREWTRGENSTVSDWGRVQRAWRNALGLRGTEAAEVLGVSPPAVTRYEKETRSPSLAYVESMVERIVAHGPKGSDAAWAVFQLAEVFESSVESALEQLDRSSGDELAERDELAARIDELPIDDVRLMLRIVRKPAALAALGRIEPRDGLKALRDALHKENRP